VISALSYARARTQIWLTRHAESVSYVIGEIGEDSGELTEAGRLYSMTLAKFIKMESEVNFSQY
jgi:broad specificity phosphatase PhoE